MKQNVKNIIENMEMYHKNIRFHMERSSTYLFCDINSGLCHVKLKRKVEHKKDRSPMRTVLWNIS